LGDPEFQIGGHSGGMHSPAGAEGLSRRWIVTTAAAVLFLVAVVLGTALMVVTDAFSVGSQ
jgi:hypothetical protein